MTTENRIFLAHASEDKPQVRRLYDQLKVHGLEPWLDAVDLIPGQNWREVIPKAIREATIFLACFSKRSIAKQGYVQREFRYALSTYAERPPGSIYLIPVRLDDCEVPDFQLAELELNLRDLHWVDLFDEGGFERLVGAIERNVKPAPAPSSQQRKPFETFKDINAPWCPEMVLLPAGSFMMGSPASEKVRRGNDGPQHEVTISQSFALGRFVVTFKEYDYFCDQTRREKPGDQGWGRGRSPVMNVNHGDAEAYCAWLSKVTGSIYQLPTEAMWEYACRAGTTTAYAFGDDLTIEEANFEYNVDQTNQVDAYPPNYWGLYGMHGNVWEWCADGRREYTQQAVTDPLGPATGDRAMRGGSWIHDARTGAAASRGRLDPEKRDVNIGFRCSRVQAS